MSKSPNILLIHSDQHRYDCIRAHGMRDLRTPNLDALVQNGVSFSRAYSTIPICTPARGSLMTGAWPTTHGSYCIPTSEIGRPVLRDLPTMTALLKAAGYKTGWVGKFHQEVEGRPEDHGVDEFVHLSGYRRWRDSLGYPASRAPRASPRQLGNYGFGSVESEVSAEHTPLAFQADNVIRLLEERREGPFFVRWDPPEPHLPCRPHESFFNFYHPELIEPWSSWPDSLEGKPHVQKRQRDIWGLHDWTWEDWQPVVARYYGIISEMDHHIGRIVARLKELGVYENTVILYSTDHGDFCGGHGLIDKHFSMYDDITRVPMIVSWPGQVPAGQTREAYVSNSIDIARTVIEVAGIERPESFVGENLIAMARDPQFQPRTEAFSQYFGTESGTYSCRLIRRDQFKLVYNPTSFDEFYDLEKDPGERFNQIDNPAYAGQVEQLRSRLWDLMREIKDPLGNAWTEVALKGAPSMAENAGLGPFSRT